MVRAHLGPRVKLSLSRCERLFLLLGTNIGPTSITFFYYFSTMQRSTYHFRRFETDGFVDYGGENVEVPARNFLILGEGLTEKIAAFPQEYSILKMPVSIVSFVDKVLDKYNLGMMREEFLTSLCAVQYAFTFYKEWNTDDQTHKDLEKERVEWTVLLNLIEKYLFTEDKKPFRSIKFDFDKQEKSTSGNLIPATESVKFRNSFVVQDIFQALCTRFNLNKNNYHVRREELLAETNSFLFSKGDLLIRKNMAETWRTYLWPNIISGKNETNRFIGLFLNLSQVNYKRSVAEIDLNIQEDVDFNLKLVDHQYVDNLIERPLKTNL